MCGKQYLIKPIASFYCPCLVSSHFLLPMCPCDTTVTEISETSVCEIGAVPLIETFLLLMSRLIKVFFFFFKCLFSFSSAYYTDLRCFHWILSLSCSSHLPLCLSEPLKMVKPDIHTLAHHLKQERLYVASEKQLIQRLNSDVLKTAERLYRAAWIAKQQRINLDRLILTRLDLLSRFTVLLANKRKVPNILYF